MCECVLNTLGEPVHLSPGYRSFYKAIIVTAEFELYSVLTASLIVLHSEKPAASIHSALSSTILSWTDASACSGTICSLFKCLLRIFVFLALTAPQTQTGVLCLEDVSF